MIRIFALLFVVMFGLTACEDGYQYTPEQPSAKPPTQTTVINEFTHNEFTAIIIDDGQRSGEHRGNQILACTRLSALQDYLDGYRGYLGCQQMRITTAEDWGYYAGHHIIRFMSQGTYFYGANDYQPPREVMNPAEYCYNNYWQEPRLYRRCMAQNAYN